MKRRRYPDINLLHDTLVITNKTHLKRPYEFKREKDKSYICPQCKCVFERVSLKRKKLYHRANPHANRHYRRGCCTTKSKLLHEGYVVNDYSNHTDSKTHIKETPFISCIIKNLLCFDKYAIPKEAIIIKKIPISEKVKIFREKFDLRWLRNRRRMAISLMLSKKADRSVKLPTFQLSYDGIDCSDLQTDTQPDFKIIKEIRPWLIKRIKYVHKYKGNDIKFLPERYNSEANRKHNDNFTDGMKEYLNLINEDIPSSIETKKRKTGLLSSVV
uniref:Uncharacterized protein n=1 Tax=viral metagenome TaxID=1070528 RepID=A0A6C0LLJ1_9ZZZZ